MFEMFNYRLAAFELLHGMLCGENVPPLVCGYDGIRFFVVKKFKFPAQGGVE